MYSKIDNSYNISIMADEQYKKEQQEKQQKNHILYNRYGVNLSDLQWIGQKGNNVISATEYKHRMTGKFYYFYTDKRTSKKIWIDENEWNSMKKNEEDRRKKSTEDAENAKPYFDTWIDENSGKLNGHKLIIYESKGEKPKQVVVVFDNNESEISLSGWSAKYISIIFKNEFSSESIRKAIIDGAIVYIQDENEAEKYWYKSPLETKYRYDKTPNKILARYNVIIV